MKQKKSTLIVLLFILGCNKKDDNIKEKVATVEDQKALEAEHKNRVPTIKEKNNKTENLNTSIKEKEYSSVNALWLNNSTPLLLYKNPTNKNHIAFQHSGEKVTALDKKGDKVWEKSIGNGNIFGGFDFNKDGWIDFAIVKAESLQQSCGTSIIHSRWIEIYSGITGNKIAEVSPIKDLCFQEFNYATNQWAWNTLLFGETAGVFAVAPQYATQGYFFTWDNNKVKSVPYIFPSTPSYDSQYLNAQLSVHPANSSHAYFQDSHVQNGIIIEYQNEKRLVMFTSSRVAQYQVGDLDENQLIADRPFLARNDLVGRNYGLVAQDPLMDKRIILLSGSSSYSVFQDSKNQEQGYDEWGAIERHITEYDVESNTVNQKFLSYAHDENDGHKYQKRLVYPNHAFIESVDKNSSHVVYNLFENGTWKVHITGQMGVESLKIIEGYFIWDIVDIDGDGHSEVIASPTVSGSYFVHNKTIILKWDASAQTLLEKQTLEGIPYLIPSFRKGKSTSSYGFNVPTLRVSKDGLLFIVTYTKNKVTLSKIDPWKDPS